jgi:sucrose-phosphate synthase
MIGSPESQLRITLISLHGLIRASDPELGRDADTGGQVKYVLELAAELARQPNVARVDLLTRQIFDDRVGTDYAQPQEEIFGKARIVRIPFGPRRYLRKELLWPYIEFFIDETLSFFKREGLPHIIHGHYADAGLAGAQLARLLHIPYIFTGHSLGRVKRQRLSIGKTDHADLEQKYRFNARIEAEETALETAAMVVASTNQEVEQQYHQYEHYVPKRMEVIAPGVDLTAFHPADDKQTVLPIEDELQRFLSDPAKPMVLTVARPDERKNLETLVEVFGESMRLQELANLVLIMGSRNDLRELVPAQRKIIQNVLALIDVYDLYGSAAYPKAHRPNDVPDLYRLATRHGSVFVNPALTEPFGLTLLEAAATGVPIIATNDGGPRDIIANCRNGLLIDPFNPEQIERALFDALTDSAQWQDWSRQGIAGAHTHYSWGRHAQQYLGEVNRILQDSATPTLVRSPKARRIPEFDRLIITDLDNTLTGDETGLREFVEKIRDSDHVGFGIETGRRLDDALKLVKELDLPTPDVFGTSVGTELYYGAGLTADRSWRRQIDYHWRPDEVQRVLESVEGLALQKAHEQSSFKISYVIDSRTWPKIAAVRRMLREAGLRARVIQSLGMYLDIIPVRGGSDHSMRHLLYKWGFVPEQVLVAGDSGNDEGMLKGETLGVVVGNYSTELAKLRGWPRIYFAEAEHARGILEGMEYYHFLDEIVIPNDRLDETSTDSAESTKAIGSS